MYSNDNRKLFVYIGVKTRCLIYERTKSILTTLIINFSYKYIFQPKYILFYRKKNINKGKYVLKCLLPRFVYACLPAKFCESKNHHTLKLCFINTVAPCTVGESFSCQRYVSLKNWNKNILEKFLSWKKNL